MAWPQELSTYVLARHFSINAEDKSHDKLGSPPIHVPTEWHATLTKY